MDKAEGVRIIADPQKPDLGLYLVAAKDAKAGDLLVREEAPLLRVTGGAGRRPLPEEATLKASSLRAANLFVPNRESPVLQRLKTEAPNNETEDGLFVRSVLHFNCFAAGVSGTDEVVYGTLARCNHSCLPNCFVDGDEGTLRAIRPIVEGEALSISYLDEASLLLSRSERQDHLRERWDFQCGCSRCSEPLDDARRFRGCHACKGELLAKEQLATRGEAELICSKCQKVASPHVTRKFLLEERQAAACLEKARSGDLEEEEEGQELMRVLRFAEQHPTHAISSALAAEFDFPEAAAAKRTLLQNLEAILGPVPCQLAIDCRRDLAKAHAVKGEQDKHNQLLKAAAEIAALLDGASSPESVLAEWSGHGSSNKPKQLPLSVVEATLRSANDLDLNLDHHAASPPARSAAASPGVAASDSAERVPDAAATAANTRADKPGDLFSQWPTALYSGPTFVVAILGITITAVAILRTRRQP